MVKKLSLKSALRYVIIVIIAFFFPFPIYWMFITAFKTPEDWFSWPPIFFTTSLTLGSFTGGGYEVYRTSPMIDALPYLRNSIIVSLSTAAIATLISTFAAYSISRLRPAASTSLIGSFR